MVNSKYILIVRWNFLKTVPVFSCCIRSFCAHSSVNKCLSSNVKTSKAYNCRGILLRFNDCIYTFASELWQNNTRMLRSWCAKCTNPKDECIRQASKFKQKCISLSQFLSSKYTQLLIKKINCFVFCTRIISTFELQVTPPPPPARIYLVYCKTS